MFVIIIYYIIVCLLPDSKLQQDICSILLGFYLPEILFTVNMKCLGQFFLFLRWRFSSDFQVFKVYRIKIFDDIICFFVLIFISLLIPILVKFPEGRYLVIKRIVKVTNSLEETIKLLKNLKHVRCLELSKIMWPEQLLPFIIQVLNTCWILFLRFIY